jgi:KDO2-lipid IV(A) lauroyltransferase
MSSVLPAPRAGARIPFTLRAVRLAAAAAAYGLWAALRVVPLDRASALAGGLARAIGPRLGLTRRARREIERSFPAMSTAEVDALVRDMWENIGRMVGEFAHLDDLGIDGPGARIELVGAEHIEFAKRAGRPSLFFAAHLGNWELGALVGRLRGLEPTLLYRAANNPHVDGLIQRCRRPVGGSMLPKGHRAARGVTEAMRGGGVVGMLVDQKTNNGVEATFFGRPAMTTQVPAMCALSYDCLLFPVRVERLDKVRFRVTVNPPLKVEPTGDRAADMRSVTQAINDLVESWVRQRPAQWMWLHRRWAD